MLKSEVSLSFSLFVECPYCHTDIDLADHDDDGCYARPIFNNKWEDLKDEEVHCPDCEKVFLIEEVVY